MNVYDTANKLAEEIKQSEEYKNFKQLKKEIEDNVELKNRVNDFENKRQKLQMDTLKNGELSQENTQELQKIYIELIKDERISKYFDAEMKFSVLIADVNKIIGEKIKDVLK